MRLKDLSSIIDKIDMILISSYNSTYISNNLLNLEYDDFVNKRKISVDKINNRNVGEDSYAVMATENNKETLFIPVLQPAKYSYNIFDMSKILSYQDLYPKIYTRNNKDITLQCECKDKIIKLVFDKNHNIFDFNTKRIEVCEDKEGYNLFESYQILTNGYYYNNINSTEIQKLDNSKIIYENIKYTDNKDIYLSTLPEKVVYTNNEITTRYNIKYHNSGMVKSIKTSDNVELCVSDCGKDSGYSLYNLVYDPFNMWNNSRNNLYSLWSLSWFVNAKRDTTLYSNDVYLVRMTELNNLLDIIKNIE